LGESLVFADEAAEDGPALDSLLGEVNGRVVWPGQVEHEPFRIGIGPHRRLHLIPMTGTGVCG
jgi:hypothetical protein